MKLLSTKSLLSCLLSAALLILSFPNFNIWLFAWFGFVPLFFALEGKTHKEAFFLFFFTGLIFWSGIIYWLVHVTLAGTIILIVYLALYFAAFGLIIRSCTKHSTPYALVFIPSVWVLLEYVRGCLFTGFPWALLGYSQYLNLPVIQAADTTGIWGISFLVMMVNVGIVEIIWSVRNNLKARLKKIIIWSAAILILSLGYGYYKINGIRLPVDKYGKQIKISIIQGNIPQELKWDERYSEFVLAKYLKLSRLAAKGNPDMIIWPEAAVPGILGEDVRIYKEVYSLAKEIKIPLLTGAVVKDRGNYFGSALLIDTTGVIVSRYDKLHRVPFGEYIPLKNVLPFLETIVPIGDIQRGIEYTVFSYPVSPLVGYSVQPTNQLTDNGPTKFAVLDCFEDVFPNLAREFVKRGAGFLVNITNDAWYKETSAPWQHLQASVFRAVENRVYLARAANTGISAFISPAGKIISLVKGKSGRAIFVDGFDTKEINILQVKPSFYTRFGDIFVLICLIIVLVGIMPQFFRKW
jgi:apolipoprotein N-acyltransferase